MNEEQEKNILEENQNIKDIKIETSLYEYLLISKNFYGGFFVRLVAYLIDLLVIYLLARILNTLTFGVIDKGELFPIIEFSLPFAITYFIYFILMTYFYSQTLGKMLLKLKVEKTNNEKLKLTDILYRELVGRLLSSFFISLPYLAIIFTNKKQGLHDYIANTIVVKEDVSKIRKKINLKIQEKKETKL